MSAASTPALPFDPATVQFDPLLRRLNLSYGPDAANVLFQIVNERHQRGRPILFTTNKPLLTAWGEVLHDHDLAEAIVDRVLEDARLLLLDVPSYRSPHLDLSAQDAHDGLHQPARIPEISRLNFRNPQ
ncbi:MAG: ATP-binding protein [Spirochaetaceae bacterium]|nr:ATP-binding protein [Spirochaetaceae bacterium]